MTSRQTEKRSAISVLHSGAARRCRPFTARPTEEVRREIEVRKQHRAGICPDRQTVRDVEQTRDIRDRADLFVIDERRQRPHPELSPSRLDLMSTHFSRRNDATRPHLGGIPQIHRFRRFDRDNCDIARLARRNQRALHAPDRDLRQRRSSRRHRIPPRTLTPQTLIHAHRRTGAQAQTAQHHDIEKTCNTR